MPPFEETAIRLDYVDTADGQVHVRSLGAGEPVALLHWAPASGRMYEPVMRALAGRGRRALAFDLPGFGRSYKRERMVAAPEMARSLGEAIGRLGLGDLVLVGGHLSANVAIEMALAAPQQVRRLVVDGVLALTPQEMHDLLAGFAGLNPRLAADGGHRRFVFDMVVATLTEWDPDFTLSDSTLPTVYTLANDYLEMGLIAMRDFVEPAGPPPEPYPALERIAAVTQPILVLTADREPLAPAYPRALAACRAGRGFRFPGAHPLMAPERAGEYADVLLGSAD